ncbi:hypothetical protein PFISCL1PPCAC_5424, partial [Pristionchus fissidentatus]
MVPLFNPYHPKYNICCCRCIHVGTAARIALLFYFVSIFPITGVSLFFLPSFLLVLFIACVVLKQMKTAILVFVIFDMALILCCLAFYGIIVAANWGELTEKKGQTVVMGASFIEIVIMSVMFLPALAVRLITLHIFYRYHRYLDDREWHFSRRM